MCRTELYTYLQNTIKTVLLCAVFISCAKVDKDAPVITIIGSKNVAVVLNSSYIDQGASANDVTDGNIVVNVDLSAVNTDSTGTYLVTYTATDAAGNKSTETRSVTVFNEAKEYEGQYSVSKTVPYPSGASSVYTETISASKRINKQIIVHTFGNYVNAKVTMNLILTNNTLSIPSQSLYCGVPSTNRTFSNSTSNTSIIGTGVPKILEIFYRETNNSSTYEAKGKYTKQ